MRILIVASVDPAVHGGGAERVAASLAEGLCQDHEVTVLSLADPQTHASSVSWEQIHVPREAPYHPSDGEEASLLEQGVWHAKELYNPACREHVTRVLDEEGPFDRASVHNIQGLSFTALDALAVHGVPTVYTIHDYKLASPVLNDRPRGLAHIGSLLRPAYQAWVRRRTQPLDRFIAPSCYIGQQLASEGLIGHDELSIIPNGVPIDVDHAIDIDTALEDAAPGLTMYGALSPHKGILTFAQRFHASDTQLELHIAGTGPLQHQIQRLADRDPRIRYLGYVEDAKLQARVARSLAVVVPSLWPENCPMVVLESLAAGTPVIHTNRGGLSEICPPGQLGLQLPKDPANWPAFIDRLDVRRLADMRGACREAAKTHYSVESMVEAYENTLEILDRGV